LGVAQTDESAGKKQPKARLRLAAALRHSLSLAAAAGATRVRRVCHWGREVLDDQSAVAAQTPPREASLDFSNPTALSERLVASKVESCRRLAEFCHSHNQHNKRRSSSSGR